MCVCMVKELGEGASCFTNAQILTVSVWNTKQFHMCLVFLCCVSEIQKFLHNYKIWEISIISSIVYFH